MALISEGKNAGGCPECWQNFRSFNFCKLRPLSHTTTTTTSRLAIAISALRVITMANRRQRQIRVSKTYRGNGRGPSGPISAIPRDAQPRAGQPRDEPPGQRSTYQQRVTRPPSPKFSFFDPPVPEPPSKPQKKSQDGLTAAKPDSLATQSVPVAGISVEDRVKEHLENDDGLKSTILRHLLDKVEKITNSASQGKLETTDHRIRIGRISFLSFLGEREEWCI